MFNREATHINCTIVLTLTLPRLKLTIYHTRHKHANHYTSEAAKLGLVLCGKCQ